MPKHSALVIKFICSFMSVCLHCMHGSLFVPLCRVIVFTYLFVMFVHLCVVVQVAPYKIIALRTRHLTTNHALAIQAACVPGHPTSQNFQTKECPDFFVFCGFLFAFFLSKKRRVGTLTASTIELDLPDMGPKLLAIAPGLTSISQ